MNLSREPGLPSALLDALRTMHEGGMLYVVMQDREPVEADQMIPCFIVRTPVAVAQLAGIQLTLTTRFVSYDMEGPLVVFHLTIYDYPPTIRPRMLRQHVVGMDIQQAQPFQVECFLDPTDAEDRRMLTALGASPCCTIGWYATDAAMTYQATRQVMLPTEQQEIARQILEHTRGIPASPERFLSARQRFLREQPLYG